MDVERKGWWVVSAQQLTDALRRAHAGEDPDHLYVELYANSDDLRGEPDAEA